MSKKVLVTGGTGFIGSNLARELVEKGYDVRITGNEAEQKVQGVKKLLQPGFLGIDWDSIGAIDVLFHQAALNDTTSTDLAEMRRGNVEGGKAMFEYAAKHGCKRIVYASSTAVYGDVPAPHKESGPVNPLSPYGVSKLEFEAWATEFAKAHPDITVVGLRYCNVYGPGESHKGKRASMIHQLAEQMRTGNPRIFRDGEQKRDYVYVKDAVRANLLAMDAKESCVVNCGYGSATTFNEVIKILNKALGLNRAPEYFENPYADRYQNFTQCDMALAKGKIGFVPEFDIEKGIADYISLRKESRGAV